MADKVLLVDDDPNILQSFQRHLRKRLPAETALGGQDALEKVRKKGPYAVILSDLRMPGMDGIEFLSLVREAAPDSVRMMLTGNADLQAAIEAVNEGNIFRFLTKPCPLNVLHKALIQGMEQYRLITAEREILQKTLRGSIKILSDVLELVNPEAFGRSSRIKHYVRDTALHLNISDVWRLEMAAMLSQIGCIILPEKVVKKLYHGMEFTEEECQLFYQHPFIALSLLEKIPRMKEIAQIVFYQEKRFDGSGIPIDSVKGEQIPLGARILKVALDLDALAAAGERTTEEAIALLEKRTGWYDPAVFGALKAVIETETRYKGRDLSISELREGMILGQDVRNTKGQLLILKGQEVSTPLITRLENYAKTAGITEPIRVIERLSGEGN